MKVIAFNFSARKDGNTARLVQHVFEPLKAGGIETEMIQLSGTSLRGCGACFGCFKNKDQKCSIRQDAANELITKMVAADGIIIASPTYFADISANAKALIERAGMVARANGNMFRRKVGAGVVAVRRGGAIHAFNSINHFFLISEMIIPGSSYWNIGIGREAGEIENDDEGVATMRDLGTNMAWLLKKLNS